jgi:hypothetical protein
VISVTIAPSVASMKWAKTKIPECDQSRDESPLASWLRHLGLPDAHSSGIDQPASSAGYLLPGRAIL